MKAYRHGDVVLVEMNHDPRWKSDYKTSTETVLATGEMTGHSHRISPIVEGEELHVSRGTSRAFGRDAWFLTIPKGGAKVTHEEHNRIDLPKGDYIAFQQREQWRESSVRRVLD